VGFRSFRAIPFADDRPHALPGTLLETYPNECVDCAIKWQGGGVPENATCNVATASNTDLPDDAYMFYDHYIYCEHVLTAAMNWECPNHPKKSK
jgi:hypothetical protein